MMIIKEPQVEKSEKRFSTYLRTIGTEGSFKMAAFKVVTYIASSRIICLKSCYESSTTASTADSLPV